MMKAEIVRQLDEHLQLVKLVRECLVDSISTCAEVLVDVLKGGGKILVMGNGGSAADAQHFAAELVGRFKMERQALPAIALTTDTSILTAVANDYGFDDVFTRQIEALAQPGDVVLGISTSGNSRNVVNAFEHARKVGAKTIGLLGGQGGKMKGYADLTIVVPSEETPRIQEVHSMVIHLLCDLVEKSMFGQSVS